jgi:ABC-2 type transport system permease protein
VSLSDGRLDDLRRLWQVTLTMAVVEFKLRYYGNALGYFWTLAKPLLMFGTLYVAFTQILHFGNEIPHYPAYLITALVLFGYFQETTLQAVPSLVQHEPLIRKIPMPMMAIPLSIALRSLFTLCLNLVAVFVFIALSGVEVTRDWLQVPFLILALVVFSTGVAALLANLFVPFRDTGPISEVLLQVAFWATPVIYTIQQVPEGLRHLIMLNPLAVILTQMRHALIDPSAPSAIGAIGGAEMLVIPAAIVVLTLVAAVALHRRTGPHLAEQL